MQYIYSNKSWEKSGKFIKIYCWLVQQYYDDIYAPGIWCSLKCLFWGIEPTTDSTEGKPSFEASQWLSTLIHQILQHTDHWRWGARLVPSGRSTRFPRNRGSPRILAGDDPVLHQTRWKRAVLLAWVLWHWWWGVNLTSLTPSSSNLTYKG